MARFLTSCLPSSWGVVLLRKRVTDLLTRIAHVIRLRVAGSVMVFAEADLLEELGKFPSLDIGQVEGNPMCHDEPSRMGQFCRLLSFKTPFTYLLCTSQ